MAETQSSQPCYPIYRGSSLGKSLLDALDKLIKSGHINPQLAVKVLTQFDKSISLALANQTIAKCTVRSAGSRLNTYNNIYDVWTFILHSPTFTFENISETVTLPGKCKIVACKARSVEVK